MNQTEKRRRLAGDCFRRESTAFAKTYSICLSTNIAHIEAATLFNLVVTNTEMADFASIQVFTSRPVSRISDVNLTWSITQLVLVSHPGLRTVFIASAVATETGFKSKHPCALKHRDVARTFMRNLMYHRKQSLRKI